MDKISQLLWLLETEMKLAFDILQHHLDPDHELAFVVQQVVDVGVVDMIELAALHAQEEQPLVGPGEQTLESRLIVPADDRGEQPKQRMCERNRERESDRAWVREK